MHDKSLFLPALAYEEGMLEDLAHVTRSLELHHWQKMDDSVTTGYQLLQRCAQDSIVFKQCIEGIGAALQIQAYFKYQFFTKKVHDDVLNKTYEYILPDVSMLEEDTALPGLVFCENALYVCRLFEKIVRDGIQNGRFKEAFRARFQEVFPDLKPNESFSVEKRIWDLFANTQRIPTIVESTQSELENIDWDYSERADTDEFKNIHMEPQSTGESQWINLDHRELINKLFVTYRRYEMSASKANQDQAYSLVRACIENQDFLWRCLERIEQGLQYMDFNDCRYNTQYYSGVGYVYTSQVNPDLAVPTEKELCACALFECLYRDGCDSALPQAIFRTHLDNIMQNPDQVKKLPYFSKLFQKQFIVNSEGLDNKSHHNIESLKKIQKITDDLHRVSYHITNQGLQKSFATTWIFSVILALLSIFINTIHISAHTSENDIEHSDGRDYRSPGV